MIPLLLDAGLPRGTAYDLRSSGWDVEHVSDRGLGGAADAAILATATLDGRVIVTLDNDFPRLLFVSGAAGPSVILIRIEGLDRPRATAVLLRIVPLVIADLGAGAIVSVTADDARVHSLPLR